MSLQDSCLEKGQAASWEGQEARECLGWRSPQDPPHQVALASFPPPPHPTLLLSLQQPRNFSRCRKSPGMHGVDALREAQGA